MTAKCVKIVVAQLNFLVGDIGANAGKIVQAAREAQARHQADAVIFPELALTGYPPEDLLLRPAFRAAVQNAMEMVLVASRDLPGLNIIFGYPDYCGEHCFNAAAVVRDGDLQANYHKHRLPNYSVFDEKRYFQAGTRPCVFDLAGIPVGLLVCEDLWQPQASRQAADAGARLLLTLNASPFHIHKRQDRLAVLAQRAQETACPVVYVNLVGGQDELLFDGESMAVSQAGDVQWAAPANKEGLYPLSVGVDGLDVSVPKQTVEPALSEEAAIYQALVLGVRDYVRKNGFVGALVGLSGGIDSALTLAIAADALGPEQVTAVMMPSRYTAQMSLDDAQAEADALGVLCHEVSIEPAFDAVLGSVENLPEFVGKPHDTTEQNIQARARGMILMALSNKTGRIVLTTGNKSEMAVGYATLYGDMCGGFAPLKDVLKLMVYRLSRYRNEIAGDAGPIIPERVLVRPPSAELAPDQQDSDNLPPYDILDRLVEAYVEQDTSVEALIAAGFEAETIKRVARLIRIAEYKRRQAPPGVRITKRAFGRDRRYPITCGYGWH